MADFIQSLQSFDFTILIKAAISALLAIYLLFTVVVATQIRSLNRIVIIKAAYGSAIIQIFSLLYILLTASLFFVTWYIL